MLQLLQMASDVANRSTDICRKAFVGAVAIRRDGVMVSSRNGSTNSNCSAKTPSIHAEARVLRKSGHGAIVYVARVCRDGSLALAKPCVRCQALLRSHGVKAVYYSVSNEEWEVYTP